MDAARILVVEDERAQRDPLVRYLKRCGYAVDAAASGEEADSALSAARYSVVITDLRLPGIDGLEVIRRAVARDPDLGVLLITAYASVDSAIEALRIGAHDYLLKPLLLDDVGRKVANLIRQRELVAENARLRRALSAQQRVPRLVAESAAMREVQAWVDRAAASRAPVLIDGETGVGKEVVARAIHAAGGGDEPFLVAQLATIPDAMIESELFGYERGAFTGATRSRDGLLRSAGRGTVFIDEIADLPDAAQGALLRALESGEVKPLGSDHAVPIEARVIAATRHDLGELVESRKFRADLYYRMNVLRVSIPPLRERPDDIPLLVQELLRRDARGSATTVSAEAMRALCRHRWPGNVRELRNVLERARMLCDEGVIDVEHLPPDVAEASAPRLTLQDAIDRFERGYIAMVLRLCDGNRERAARELGISPATLYRRLERHSLKTENRATDDSHS
ncbi:MAG: sigma-54-dependent Fis family transcriptional regulator [Deltaproteobacteria bacterium]|nr:MAG: sigma-54-dependent Fis family transcriptional regulator [Deltaproteobacteria bacterium]